MTISLHWFWLVLHWRNLSLFWSLSFLVLHKGPAAAKWLIFVQMWILDRRKGTIYGPLWSLKSSDVVWRNKWRLWYSEDFYLHPHLRCALTAIVWMPVCVCLPSLHASLFQVGQTDGLGSPVSCMLCQVITAYQVISWWCSLPLRPGGSVCGRLCVCEGVWVFQQSIPMLQQRKSEERHMCFIMDVSFFKLWLLMHLVF